MEAEISIKKAPTMKMGACSASKISGQARSSSINLVS